MKFKENNSLYVALGNTNAGWVQMVLMSTPGLDHIVIHASDVHNPFPALKKFLGRVQRNQGPQTITINEERAEKTLIVIPSIEGRGYVEFAVVKDCTDELDAALFRCRIKRSDLLVSFDRGVARWLADGYDVNQFGGGYGVEPSFDMGKLWANRLAKLPKLEIKTYLQREVKLPKGFYEK